MIYYAETTYGASLGEAANLESARREVLREVGSYGFKAVRVATKQDIAWVESMGGWSPVKASKHP